MKRDRLPADAIFSVNEVFNPEKTDDVFAQSPEVRAQVIAANKATNYGVVRLDLLERIYSALYSYGVKRLPQGSWPHRIFNHSAVSRAYAVETDDKPALQLEIQSNSNLFHREKTAVYQSLDVDLVVVATGYERNIHEELMRDLETLRPDEDARWSVDRDYTVRFKEGALEEGRGIILQGCNQSTHGLPDSLLSILSVRAGEVVKSIFPASKEQ